MKFQPKKAILKAQIMKIGIFDSGLGGLSLLHSAWQKLDAKYIYYADEAHVPYGEKSPDEVLGFVSEIIEFLIAQNVDAIVIACNTASSVFDYLKRAKYALPIIAMEPALKKATDENPDAKILVTATQITINGEKLRLLAQSLNAKADFLALGGLVRLAESGDFDALAYLSKYKEILQNNEILVLGCTHFNYFKSEFLKINPNLKFVDGNLGTIKQLARSLNFGEKSENLSDFRKFDLNGLLNDTEFFISGKKANANEINLIKTCFERLDIQYKI